MNRLIKDGAIRGLCIVGHVWTLQGQETNNEQRLCGD
jgi:hypothetical protein